MKDAVRSNFVAFNGPLEGVLPFMYTDSLDYVTTAMGFLLPDAQSATALPWKNADGSLADSGTVMAAWQAVKDGPTNSSSGAGYLTTIRLDADGIQAATDKRIAEDEPYLKRDFPTYDTCNAYAQLTLWSMAWAMGPAFRSALGFTQFGAAFDRGDYAAAAPLGHFRGSGVETRIAADDQLLAWAAQSDNMGASPESLNVTWIKMPSGIVLSGGPSLPGLLGGILFPMVALVGAGAYLFRDQLFPYVAPFARWLKT